MTSRLNLRPVSFWPFTPLDEVAQASSFTCSEGRLAPRGRVHCNDVRSEHRVLVSPRIDHGSRPSPRPRTRACRRHWRTRGNSTEEETSHPGGWEVPRAPKRRHRLQPRGDVTEQTTRPGGQVGRSFRRSGDCSPDRRPHLSVRARSSRVDRREAVWTVHQSPCRAERDGRAIFCHLRRPKHSRSLLPARKQGCVCAAGVRIPGPDAPVAAALTPTHRPRRLGCSEERLSDSLAGCSDESETACHR